MPMLVSGGIFFFRETEALDTIRSGDDDDDDDAVVKSEKLIRNFCDRCQNRRSHALEFRICGKTACRAKVGILCTPFHRIDPMRRHCSVAVALQRLAYQESPWHNCNWAVSVDLHSSRCAAPDTIDSY